ncbi:NAD(P)/FAD-dependent oxidoreductase [Fluviicola sp.]|uniref:NAD(P)/FAD-dependent oxidoreductase n=1 Tax=Fluviicola sp. TaxID=1917219 RepID=UPI003D27DC4E
MDLKSNEPFWLIKNGLINSYPSLQSDESCDVLIVGGGITGSLIAHQMTKDGFDTILIDKREVCNGSTSATTSMLQYEIDVPLSELIEKIGENGAVKSYRACADSILEIEKLAKKLGSQAGFQLKTSFYYATDKADLIRLKLEYETRKKYGFAVRWLNTSEVQDKFGFQNTCGGILSELGASIDAFRFGHELLEYNQKRGLRIYDKTELRSVQHKRGFNLATTENGSRIRAGKIIYCTGYESAGMIPEKIVSLKSTYALVSEIDPVAFKSIEKTLFWDTDSPYLYFRTTDDHRFLIGGGDEDFQNAQKRDKLLNAKEKEILTKLKKLNPGFEVITDFIWAGTFGETKDGLPYIGEHPKFKNAYFVLGFGGNGITFSAIGMEMVSLFMKKKKHPLSRYFKFGR